MPPQGVPHFLGFGALQLDATPSTPNVKWGGGYGVGRTGRDKYYLQHKHRRTHSMLYVLLPTTYIYVYIYILTHIQTYIQYTPDM